MTEEKSKSPKMTSAKSVADKTPKKADKTVSTEKSEKTVPNKNSGKLAVIKTGGKQYVVHEGFYFDVEKLDAAEGEKVIFEEVLLIADGGEVKIGRPKIEGAKVTAEVLRQFKDKKVKVLKYKPKKRQKKVYGHRQNLTKVKVISIK